MMRANSSTASVASGVTQVGQDVREDDAPRLAADHLGGLDEGSLLGRQHDAAGHAGVDHPAVDGEDDRSP